MLPEYAYTTESKQPSLEALNGVLEQLVSEGGFLAGPPANWVTDTLETVAFITPPEQSLPMAFLLGYIAAVNRIPTCIIDPKETLNAR